MSTTEAFRLSDDEAALVVAESSAAARVLPEPARDAAMALADAADTGTIPVELLDVLGDVLVASIQGGRARQLYRANGEKTLNRLLTRTPVGKERSAHIDEVNTALSALNGRQIDSIRVGARSPGQHTLTITTQGITLTLGVTGAGVTVESVTT